MTRQDAVTSLLERVGALRQGHFVLSSGLHSERYCQCAALFEHPTLAAEAAGMLLAMLPAGTRIDAVLAPALGGVLWGYEIARALGVRSLFAERDAGGPFQLRRGFAIDQGARVLLAEDVVTTGGSVMELLPLVEQTGASVIGIAAVADRSRGRFKPPVPLYALCALDFEAVEPQRCPQCAAGIPATKPGSRAERDPARGEPGSIRSRQTEEITR